MPDSTYKMVKIVGTSAEGHSQAIRNAVAKASQTLKGIGWFQVVEERGLVKDGAVQEFQVVLEIGFRLLDNPAD